MQKTIFFFGKKGILIPNKAAINAVMKWSSSTKTTDTIVDHNLNNRSVVHVSHGLALTLGTLRLIITLSGRDERQMK